MPWPRPCAARWIRRDAKVIWYGCAILELWRALTDNREALRAGPAPPPPGPPRRRRSGATVLRRTYAR